MILQQTAAAAAAAAGCPAVTVWQQCRPALRSQQSRSARVAPPDWLEPAAPCSARTRRWVAGKHRPCGVPPPPPHGPSNRSGRRRRAERTIAGGRRRRRFIHSGRPAAERPAGRLRTLPRESPRVIYIEWMIYWRPVLFS